MAFRQVNGIYVVPFITSKVNVLYIKMHKSSVCMCIYKHVIDNIMHAAAD